MSDFKEDPSEWAESDEREIRPDAIVLRGWWAQEAARAMLAWAGHVTAEEVEDAARALFGEVTGAPLLYDSLDEGAQRTWRARAAAVLAAAGFTVVEEGEA